MKRLLHCPFCGEYENVRLFKETSANFAHTYAVACDTCGTQGPKETSSFRNVAQDTAIDRWNDRLTVDEDTRLRVTFALTS